jgi:hypothetical protein
VCYSARSCAKCAPRAVDKDGKTVGQLTPGRGIGLALSPTGQSGEPRTGFHYPMTAYATYWNNVGTLAPKFL